MNSIPNISLNMLDEFRNATPSRKASILKSFKFSEKEDKIRSNQNNSTKAAIIAYLTDDKHDIKIFEERRKLICSRKRATKWQTQDIENSLQALKNIEDYANNIFGKYFKYEIITNRSSEVKIRTRKIRGVVVHMNPDLLLRQKGTNEIVGVIKLVFSKNKKMTPMKGQIVSGFIKDFVEKEFQKNSIVSNFMAFDVFHKNPITANLEFNLHRTLINKALDEINSMWNSIK